MLSSVEQAFEGRDEKVSSPINACLGGYVLCRGSKITGAHGLSSSSSKYL